MSRRDKQGTERKEQATLPARIDDYVGENIGENNRVRAIDAFVDTLDLAALGFQRANGELTAGQPAFAPVDLLKQDHRHCWGLLQRQRQRCERHHQKTPGNRTQAG